jgi:hypothetical protein
MPEAYDLTVPNQLNVIYKVNLPIKDVVAFYQQVLPNYGWEQVKNPENVDGSKVQMTTGNENADRIIISLEHDTVGDVTVVQIYLTRST